MVSYWLINLAAFFVAEVLDSGAYLGDENPWVVGAALAVYVALALAAYGAWRLVAHVLGRTGVPPARLARLEPGLAFAPGLALLAPKLRVAAGGGSPEILGLVPLVVGGAWMLSRLSRPAGAEREQGGLLAYAWLSLAIWAFAMPVAGLAAAVDRSTTTMGVLWGYNRVAAMVAGAVSLAWGWYLAHAAHQVRHGLLSAAFAVVLVAVTAISRPIDAPLIARWEPPAAVHPGHEPPPVIVITMDTTRADHLSVYGYPRDTTPSLRALARDAVVHSNAFATSSWTLPSHASLFTGLLPSHHQADRTGDGPPEAESEARRPPGAHTRPLAHDKLTLAEWLSSNGYRTAAVAANFAYLSRAFGLDQGFGVHDVRANSGTAFVVLDVVDRRLIPLPWLRRALLPYRPARAINERALGWIASVHGQPFLLFLNYMEPHTPNVPGLHYAEFADEGVGPRLAATPGDRTALDLYDSEIASMDAEIGHLLDGLRHLGLYDRSLIVVTADHGESLGEHGAWGHGYTLNEPEVRIPLIVKYPGSSWHGRRRRPVSLVDVLPTISREVGVEFPGGLDGEHLLRSHHKVIAELHATPAAPGSITGPGVDGVALYDRGRKLVWSHDGHWRVYDLATDPGELYDVARLHRLWSRDRVGSLMSLRARN